MQSTPFQNKRAKLLGVAFPAIPEIVDTLKPLMEKYNIPLILPEDKELQRTVHAERTDEEWTVIKDEIETNLRKRFEFIPTGLRPLYNSWKKNPDGYLKIKGIRKLPAFLREPITKLLTTLLEFTLPSFQLLDRVYKFLSDQLFDHLTKGSPVAFPDFVFGGTLVAAFPPENDKVVFAYASEIADPVEIARQFQAKIIETFGEKPNVTDDNLKGAEYFVLEKYGKSREDIVTIDEQRYRSISRRIRRPINSLKIRRRQRVDKTIQRTIDKMAVVFADKK